MFLGTSTGSLLIPHLAANDIKKLYTIFTNVKFLDPTLLIWRSSSHWIGGLFFLIFLILIFSNFKNEYKLTHLVYNPDKATNLFKDTNKILIKVFFLY